MNGAIGVALITALSTLTGIAISGSITLLVARNQNNTQRTLTGAVSEGERARDTRKIRRDVYVQFLNEVSWIEHQLDNFWTGIGISSVDDLFNGDIDAVRNRLNPLLNLIDLEGPDDVAKPCLALTAALSIETIKAASGCHPDHGAMSTLTGNPAVRPFRLLVPRFVSGRASFTAAGGSAVTDRLDAIRRRSIIAGGGNGEFLTPSSATLSWPHLPGPRRWDYP